MPDTVSGPVAQCGWDGAGAPGGASSRPEPGAGSAGPGAAQRRRLIQYGLIRQRSDKRQADKQEDTRADKPSRVGGDQRESW